jgi:hypothetical protein
MSSFNYRYTTQVPNELFDKLLSSLTFCELKVYLFIIRKTHGFVLKNGKRKERDRISHSQFIKATGISRRNLPITIQSLVTKRLISVSDYEGNSLSNSEDRKGKMYIYYAPLCSLKQKPVQVGQHNKTKQTKLKRKSDWERVKELRQEAL